MSLSMGESSTASAAAIFKHKQYKREKNTFITVACIYTAAAAKKPNQKKVMREG